MEYQNIQTVQELQQALEKYPKELSVAVFDDTIGYVSVAFRKEVAETNGQTRQRDIEEQAYEKRKQQVKRLEKAVDEYVILAPDSLQDIVHEGSALHHCVGGQTYLKQHAEGKTTILFLRQKAEPEVPYFTLEYRNQRIVQIQGNRNREAVPPTVKTALEKWKRAIKVATPN